MQTLVKNSQIKRENDVPMVEAHLMDCDEKLADIKKEMEKRKLKFESQQENKCFWRKIFNK